MEYTIDTSKQIQLNYGAKGVERILQNIWNLCNTYRYEVAYNRTLGIDPRIFDKPANVAAVLYSAEVYRVIGDYEPRARVKEVKHVGTDDEGNMQFEVVVEI